jgi:hypothetical protein
VGALLGEPGDDAAAEVVHSRTGSPASLRASATVATVGRDAW